METFDVVSNSDAKIILKSEKQMESLFEQIKVEAIVLIRWEDDDGNYCARILPTEGLMARIKDGRFILESSRDSEDEE